MKPCSVLSASTVRAKISEGCIMLAAIYQIYFQENKKAFLEKKNTDESAGVQMLLILGNETSKKG